MLALFVLLFFKQRVHIVNHETQHQGIDCLAEISRTVPLQVEANAIALHPSILGVLRIILKAQAKSQPLCIIPNGLAHAPDREDGIDGPKMALVQGGQALVLSLGVSAPFSCCAPVEHRPPASRWSIPPGRGYLPGSKAAQHHQDERSVKLVFNWQQPPPEQLPLTAYHALTTEGK